VAGALYIGLMSGTSLDGIDAVLASFEGPSGHIALLAHHHQAFEPSLRESLWALNTPGSNELHRAALAANALGRAYADTVQALLHVTGTDRRAIAALGAHGQTVRHRPGEFDGTGYTLQLINGAMLAELTGIDAVVDFRTRDVVAGGQGAPLVPVFHHALFRQCGRVVAVLNLGGIANLSLLGMDDGVRGFDCGPGNALLDLWCHRHFGNAYDAAGAWAAGGHVLPLLLQRMLAEPFFLRAPPKSTGRDLFNAEWLQAKLDTLPQTPEPKPRDVQATLAELTAQTVAADLHRHQPATTNLLLCGGGALNDDLVRRLERALPGLSIASTATHGVPPMQVEAAAFAWLARQHAKGRPANDPHVTGARGLRILGCRYPA
jgi:anhydro-N-acetylmuramic acid kinase